MNRVIFYLTFFISITFPCFFKCYAEKPNFDPIAIYADRNNLKNVIKLKIIDVECEYCYFSYIIELNEQMSNDSAVYLVLVDSSGFPVVHKIFVSNIGKGFKGEVKGQFSVQLKEQIGGAELTYFEPINI